MRRVHGVCLLLLALAVACTRTNTAETTSPTVAPTAPPSAAPEQSSTPVATGASPSAEPRQVTGTVAFQSPTGNIRCEMSNGASTPELDLVRCDTLSHTWSPPPKPADCQFDWYGSLGVDSADPARFLCVSDAVQTGPVLPYGEAIRHREIVCQSLTDGIRCFSRPSGRGFRVSRQSYSLF